MLKLNNFLKVFVHQSYRSHLATTLHGNKVRKSRRFFGTKNSETEILESADLSKVVQLPNFTEAETKHILSIINNQNVQQLLSYDISKARINRLHNWKSRNGPLRALEDILYVEGFGLKIATKFYRSLLEPTKVPTEVKKKTVRSAPFITPTIDEQQRSKIRSCVAIRIGVTSVTWSRLSLHGTEDEISEQEVGPCLLTHWQHHELTDKKLHLSDLVQRCLYLVHQLPTADCYVFENPQMAQANNNPGNAEQQNINIQKAQVTAVLSYALATRGRDFCENVQHEKTTQSIPNAVFYLRRFLTARLFSNLVGTERVSSEDTVLKLMRTHYNIEAEKYFEDEETNQEQTSLQRESIRGRVQFPADMRQMYSKAERYHREFLGQSLLLNLAFVRLILLMDAECIAAVTNRGGNKTSKTDDVAFEVA